jgi:crotonobetainyl-CoA:carnitine CoA-transferase CaiB-like acyl-CoA transferase
MSPAANSPPLAQAGFLHGVRVVDMTTVVFGPYATHMLADLGADVIKIEPPEGDPMRLSGKPARTSRMSPAHMTLNRGKRSVVLDLKRPEDAEALTALIRTADVFIHNVRAKAIDKLGFGYETVRAIRPDIIYVHGVGFGQSGPYADLQAYDDVIQAATGTASLAGRVDGDPRPRYVPSLIADKVAGLYGAQAVLAALVHRLRTGRGQYVEAPMFEAFAHFMLEEHLGGQVFDPPTAPAGYPRQLDPSRQPFPTANGHICIVPYTDASVVTCLEILGRPDLATDPRFATPVQRARHMTDLYALIATLTPARTTADWVERFRAARIPAMPVTDLCDVMKDPHLEAVGFFRRREHPTEGAYFEMQPPIRYSDRASFDARYPPRLGEHTEEVLEEIGAGSRPTAG